MTHPHTSKPGDPIWVDLYTGDPDRSIAFYRDLFGWTADRADEEFGGYITFRKDGRAVAGGMGKSADDQDAPDQWTVYLSVADATAAADTAVAQGGAVVLPAMPVGDLGTMAILADAGGAAVGLWQAGAFHGFEAVGVASGGQWSDHAGVPTWFELHTRAYDATVEFYRTVFGWQDTFAVQTPEAPEFRYTTIHAETPMLGGVMDVVSLGTPEEVPARWNVYFGADDVEKAAERVIELGGAIVMPVMDTPYGRMVSVADPTGATFNIGGNK